MVDRSFSDLVQKTANGQRDMQLLARAMVNGVISERDRLLQYSVGEIYEEMSLFIQETELRKKAWDDATKKNN